MDELTKWACRKAAPDAGHYLLTVVLAVLIFAVLAVVGWMQD